ncbi:MAG: AvaI/BsoBI family type II restriction endonuclease [Trichormus sp.]
MYGRNNIESMSSHRHHLQSSDDLVTTYEATRAGFIALALEKNRRATPYVAEARILQEAASQAKWQMMIQTLSYLYVESLGRVSLVIVH